MRRADDNRRGCAGSLSIAIAGFAAIVYLATAGAEARDFGTRCQKTFENDWLATVPYAYVRCSGFNATLDDTDTKQFYFNLVGGESGFTFFDGFPFVGGVDAVDLFYVSTHGGVTNTDATLAFFNEKTRARSSRWRFGDNGASGAAIFSQYACHTLARDVFTAVRWVNAFRGGLLIATGSHGLLWDGYTTDETGEDYADDLQDGKSVKWAWLDANSDWYLDQDVAVIASGTDATNCQARRDAFRWQVLEAFPRLRDSDIRVLCSSAITRN